MAMKQSSIDRVIFTNKITEVEIVMTKKHANVANS